MSMSRDLDHLIALTIKRVAWGLLLAAVVTVGGCSALVYTIAAKFVA